MNFTLRSEASPIDSRELVCALEKSKTNTFSVNITIFSQEFPSQNWFGGGRGRSNYEKSGMYFLFLKVE